MPRRRHRQGDTPSVFEVGYTVKKLLLSNLALFIVPSLIWGSTWYVIKFQLGTVDPIVSVCYRFAIAGLVMLVFCRLSGLNLRFTRKDHLFIALQGCSLFGINYWLVYWAEQSLVSGLVAIVFSCIVFLNIFFSGVLLRMPFRKRVFAGAVCGVGGTALIYRSELSSFTLEGSQLAALGACLVAVVLASLGNILSARNQRQGLPVIQTNALGMTYGAVAMLLFAVLTGREFVFDTGLAYVGSLMYLSVFGSIIAFGTYLKLLGNIGPDRAAYAVLVIPIIALIMSSLFEGFVWTGSALLGIAMILVGNIVALKSKEPPERA